jgi:hypothetical protein
MAWACSMRESDEKFVLYVGWKTLREETTWTT